MKIQHELKRPVPFSTPQQETLVNLLRVGDQLDNRLSRLFREHGLTLSRFNILRNLSLAERPLTCGEIGERMVQMVPAITSLVDHLEEQGLVERQRSCEDRRIVHIQITKRGREVSDALLEPLAELEKSLLKRLTRAELKTLIELLEKTRLSITESQEAL